MRGELALTSRKPTWLGEPCSSTCMGFSCLQKWTPNNPAIVTVLSKTYAICGPFLLRDGVSIGELKDKKWFQLDAEHDDSLTRQDLMDLEVPI